MRLCLTLLAILTAMLAGPVAHGQTGPIGTQGASGRPSAPPLGGVGRALVPKTRPTIAPPGDALSNLAGGGYADPNYVPPGERAKTSHRTDRARWPRGSRRFGHYATRSGFWYGSCFCYCGGYY